MTERIFPIQAYCTTTPCLFAKNEAARLLSVLVPWVEDHQEGDCVLDFADVPVVTASGATILCRNLIERFHEEVLIRLVIRNASNEASLALDEGMDAALSLRPLSSNPR